MDNTIKIKISSNAISDLMIAINNRIKFNKSQMKLNETYGLTKYNKRYIEINKNLKKIHGALAGVKPILIEEEF